MPTVAAPDRVEATHRAERRDNCYRLLGGLWKTNGIAVRGYKASDGQTVWIRDNTLTRVRTCRRHELPNQQAGVSWDTEQQHHFGLNTCASIWACPVCSAKIRHHRSLEVQQILTRHLEEGGKIGFVTLTLSHHTADQLVALLDAIAESWRGVISGRAWTALSKLYGIDFGRMVPNENGYKTKFKVSHRIGLIRSLEIKYSANGYHPHLHVFVLYRDTPLLPGFSRDELRRHITHQWRKEISSHGYRVGSRVGVLWKDVTLANVETIAAYSCKVQDGTAALAAEITRSDLKNLGKAKSGRGLFDILADYVIDGDAQAGAIWLQYERATKGRQAITFGKGLRERFNVEVTSDEDLAAERVGGENTYWYDKQESRWVRQSTDNMISVYHAVRTNGYLGLIDLFTAQLGHASGGFIPAAASDPWANAGYLDGEQLRFTASPGG